MELRPMKPAEQKYNYSQSMQLQGQTGSIGYLRGDFGSSGKEFHTTWFDHRTQWKTEEFKAGLDTVINALRSTDYGLLKSRSDMISRAGKYPDSRFKGNYSTEYGFRMDTEQHAHLIRFNPSQGDYNFYCFCYVKEWLNKHMANAERGIRFIDPHYNELFRIPDGGKITIITSWGEKNERTCRYIDEAHTEIGSNLYHICEFAERMQQNGSSYEPKPTEGQFRTAVKNKEQER